MKKTKISLLALAVLAGGITAASAASSKVDNAATYVAHIQFPTNAPLGIIGGVQIPTSAVVLNGAVYNNQFLSVDGSGKIEGASKLRFVAPGGTNAPVAVLSAVVTVTGKISGKENTQPTIDLTIKGNGYSGGTTNALELYSKLGVPATISLKFKGNTYGGSIGNRTNCVGTLNGTLKTGIELIDNATKGKVKDALATAAVGDSSSSEFGVNVVQLGDKLYLQNGNLVGSGKGSVVNGKKLSGSLKGVGFAKGSSVKISGTSAILPVAGNTNQTVVFVSAAEISGKLAGQSFKRSGLVTTADQTPPSFGLID